MADDETRGRPPRFDVYSDGIWKELTRLSTAQENLSRSQSHMAIQIARIETSSEGVEEKLDRIEKAQTDQGTRRWQVTLAILTAVIALVISLAGHLSAVAR